MTPRRSGLHAVLAAAFLVGAAAVPQTAPTPVPDPNPLMARSTLPYQAPPFDRLKDTDYEPAIEAGMKEQLAEMARSPTTRPHRPSRTPSRRWSAPESS